MTTAATAADRSDAATVWDLVAWRAALTPDALFARDERGVEVSFSGFAERALRVAAGLSADGVGVGSVVAWQLPTWIESMVLCAALARLGAVQVPLIPSYRAREVGFILRQTGAERIIIPSEWAGFDFAAMAGEVAPEGTDVMVLDPVARLLPDGDPDLLGPEPGAGGADAVRWVYYTSGTTGEPKGAKHSDRTLADRSPACWSCWNRSPRTATVSCSRSPTSVAWCCSSLGSPSVSATSSPSGSTRPPRSRSSPPTA